MRVIVDTPIWSLALRRGARGLSRGESDGIGAFRELLGEGRCLLLGVVRQEVLQGISKREQFEVVRRDLDELPDEPIWSADHVLAARMYDRCRAQGVQPATVDMLLCAVAARAKAAIFTLDRDFLGYARTLGTRLFRPNLD